MFVATQGWTNIMNAVAADPWASAYTIFDILNEPDAQGLCWQARNGAMAMGDMYHNIMNIGYQINPCNFICLHLLFDS